MSKTKLLWILSVVLIFLVCSGLIYSYKTNDIEKKNNLKGTNIYISHLKNNIAKVKKAS
jgi:hypothetical protein